MRSQRRQLPGNTAGCARRKHGKAHSAWVDTNVGSIITIMRIRSRFGASAAPRRSGPFVTNARAPKKSSNQLEPKAARYVKWDGALPGLCIRVEQEEPCHSYCGIAQHFLAGLFQRNFL